MDGSFIYALGPLNRQAIVFHKKIFCIFGPYAFTVGIKRGEKKKAAPARDVRLNLFIRLSVDLA